MLASGEGGVELLRFVIGETSSTKTLTFKRGPAGKVLVLPQ